MGKPIGIGTKIYPDGKSKEGYWDKGKFIEGKAPIGFLDEFSPDKEQQDTNKNEVDEKPDISPFSLGQKQQPAQPV